MPLTASAQGLGILAFTVLSAGCVGLSADGKLVEPPLGCEVRHRVQTLGSVRVPSGMLVDDPGIADSGNRLYLTALVRSGFDEDGAGRLFVADVNGEVMPPHHGPNPVGPRALRTCDGSLRLMWGERDQSTSTGPGVVDRILHTVYSEDTQTWSDPDTLLEGSRPQWGGQLVGAEVVRSDGTVLLSVPTRTPGLGWSLTILRYSPAGVWSARPIAGPMATYSSMGLLADTVIVLAAVGTLADTEEQGLHLGLLFDSDTLPVRWKRVLDRDTGAQYAVWVLPGTVSNVRVLARGGPTKAAPCGVLHEAVSFDGGRNWNRREFPLPEMVLYGSEQAVATESSVMISWLTRPRPEVGAHVFKLTAEGLVEFARYRGPPPVAIAFDPAFHHRGALQVFAVTEVDDETPFLTADPWAFGDTSSSGADLGLGRGSVGECGVSS